MAWSAGAFCSSEATASLAREHYGFADLDAQRRTDDHTIYHWASITKTFTAIALMQLRDRGRLSLDDPAVRHVPELRLAHNPFGPIEAVTGSQRGFRAFFSVAPERGVGVIAAFNTAAAEERAGIKPDIAAIREGLLDRLARKAFPLFPTR
jgi:hypothetical protein